MIILDTDYIKISHFFTVSDNERKCDYDICIFGVPLNAEGVNENSEEVVFYNNLWNKNKSIWNPGDCFSECSDCGDGSIIINLSDISDDERTLVFFSELYESKKYGVCFGDGYSDVIVSKIEKPKQCVGEVILSQRLEVHIYCDVIELCRLIRIDSKWGIEFPKEAGINMSIEDYLSHLGVKARW